MTYKIEIELADIVGPDLDLVSETEQVVEGIVDAVLRHREIVDIGQLLAEHHAIAQVWDVSHVQEQRPDLTDEQAWEVLQECAGSWDRLNDPMLFMIRMLADKRFPMPRAKAALLARLRRVERQIQALPDSERTNPAGYGFVAAELDDVATLVGGA